MRIQFVIVAIFIFAACAKERNFKAQHLYDRVMDKARLFTEAEVDSINSLIEKLELEIGSQVAVLTVKSPNSGFAAPWALNA